MIMMEAERYDDENLPVHNDWSPQYMGQTEHVKLLQTLPGLTGERQEAGPLLEINKMNHEQCLPPPVTVTHL